MEISRPLLLSFTEKYFLLILNVAGTMLLARLLTPAEIGVYALAAVLSGLLQSLRDFGVGNYLIQETALTEEKLRAALASSLLVATILALLVFSGSWLAQWFYHDARIGTVLRWLSLNFLLIPYSALALPYLRRQMRFKAVLAINCCSASAQLCVGAGAAWLGYSYLSLAWGALAAALTTLIASLLCRPQGLPRWPSRRGMGNVLAYGSIATAGSMIDEAGVAAPELILGRFGGVMEVAMYGKAIGLLNVFNQLVTSAVSPVIYPWFSVHARRGQPLQQVYLKTARYMTALAWPFFGFVALAAPELVRLLYGSQWDGCVVLIRIMCLSSALYSMFSMVRYLLLALGAVAAQARLDALAVLARVALVLLAAPFGLYWVAWAVVGGAIVRCALTLFYLQRVAATSSWLLWRAVHGNLWLALSSLIAPCWLLHSNPTAELPWRLLWAALAMLPGWWLGLCCFQHELAKLCSLAGRKAVSHLLGT